jgi:hypothetical protein
MGVGFAPLNYAPSSSSELSRNYSSITLVADLKGQCHVGKIRPGDSGQTGGDNCSTKSGPANQSRTSNLFPEADYKHSAECAGRKVANVESIAFQFNTSFSSAQDPAGLSYSKKKQEGLQARHLQIPQDKAQKSESKDGKAQWKQIMSETLPGTAERTLPHGVAAPSSIPQQLQTCGRVSSDSSLMQPCLLRRRL